MNLAFTDDELAMRDEYRRVLASSSARQGLAAIEQHGHSHDHALWQRLADTGWLAAGVPEAAGGSDLGDSVLCLLAEETGRVAPALPYVASACGFAGGLRLSGAQPAAGEWLARVADGNAIGIVLLPQDWSVPAQLDETAGGWRLRGATRCVRDGAAANAALALVGSGGDAAIAVFALPEDRRSSALDTTLDVLHPPAAWPLVDVPAGVLARGAAAHALWQQLLDRLALFTAFEQLGGAQAMLEMARDYSLTRYAFGRAIGSFQALKHTMADMLAALEVARSNCYYGAAALAGDGSRLAEAAAVARITATDAYRLCAKQNMQIHGGIGVTWESDAHLHYRRAQSLATALGAPAFWKERLIALLIAARAPRAA